MTFMAAEVFIVTPFEHARKRLQIQSLKPVRKRKAGEAMVPFSTCVDVNNTKRYEVRLLKKKKGDWQDLYASPLSAANSKAGAGKSKSILANGVCEGLRDAGDQAWDI
ncbi:hypothetical protein BC830DRAFT_1085052 [Chytriomyces sp. MP71]|nr:hypothetical protein BC830DRAFT_1085052 [Chytriomyces sp. MP71]